MIEPDEFATRYGYLSDDEQEILSEFLRRIEMGSEQYGPLDLNRDDRDFRKEGAEELADFFFYFIADSLKRGREGR